METEWKKVNGGCIPVEISARVADAQEGIIQIIARDISERKRREEEKLKIEKLESIGILSGGIAHDFNNLLSVILGNISLAQNDADTGNRSLDLLKSAETACMRSKDLIRQLITFSQGGAPVKKTCPIADLIHQTVDAVAGPSNSKGVVEIATNLWPLECDPEQIDHALSNVLKNAVEAMPAGGVLKVKAENHLADEPETEPATEAGIDKYVKIIVSDQGGGIAPENRLKIFDPYFSTKQRGDKKGMGLGLTTANSIIEKHDGYIRVESGIKRGTAVQIYLPAATGPVCTVPEHEKPIRKSDRETAGKFILMMDDENMILELGRIMLKRLGYEAEFAADGERALELFKKAAADNRPYDAVILDLTIKHGISGIQTLKKMLAIDPETRAIVSSGYSEDPVMTMPEAHAFRASLPKPYTSADLKRVLAKVLAGD